MRLADKVALVTGVQQGIGRAIALTYGGEGAREGIRINAIAPGHHGHRVAALWHV